MSAPSSPLTRPRGQRIGQLLGTTTFQLASGIIALFVIAAAAIVWMIYAQTNVLLTEQVMTGLRREAEALTALARDGGTRTIDRAIAERSEPRGVQLYFLADGRGVRLAGNLVNVPTEVGADPRGGVFRYVAPPRVDAQQGVDAGTRLAVAIPVPVGPDRRLIVGRDVEDQRAFADKVRRIFLVGFGGLAVAGLVGGFMVSRLVVRRIEDINSAARSIMAGDLARRITTGGNGDEIDGLAQNLNRMLDRIEQLMGGLREVSDNIAHDLKTPLNRLRNRAEAALRENGGAGGYRQGLERVIEEADELIKTFNALLLIARLEAGAVEENMEVFDSGALVRDVAELYEPVTEEAGLSLRIDATGGPQIKANRQLIGQAVANLIDNAIKYGVRNGGVIGVQVVTGPDGLDISVSDQGPGIAPEDRERAVKRFVRLERSRTKPGTGLGLSLVTAVARLHGGTVRLEDNGPGLKVVVSLPKRLYSE